MRTLIACLLLGAAALLAAGGPVNQLTAEEKAAGYVLLFNGRDLAGWRGDEKVWSVRDGVIIGSTDKHTIQENTFLIYKDSPADFILKADILLRNGNSGIQFRSKVLEGFIVMGYQADASDAGDRSAWGNFYEERGRGRGVMKTPDAGWQNAKDIVHTGDWNEYEILAQGKRIQLKLNGKVTMDLEDGEASSGVIAFQLHRGDPMEVRLRNVKLKVLR